MIVHVTKTEHGSTTGLNDIRFEAGRDYDMPDALAEVFLREGWAHESGVAYELQKVADAPEYIELSAPVEVQAAPVETEDAPSPAMVRGGSRPARPPKAKE